ncbi:MAG: site-specific integrase, partial [Clostridia bacterium]|nr:site-specific integrase [Clostridia bacterium]
DNMNALRFMAFLMYTGLRPCEIYGLRWEDIDPVNMLLTIQRDLVFVSGEGILGEPKTEESRRTIPFDPELLRLISPIESSGFIIHMTEPGREHEHFTERASQTMWYRIKKHLDVHGMTPYMGRHTYATNMNKAGVSIKTAMTMMGHKDERMLLRRYTHTDAEDLTNASASVSDRLASMRAG